MHTQLAVKKLVETRTERGWSQRRLAKEADIHLNTIWKTETEKSHPSYEVAIKISRALGVNPREITEFAPVVQAAEGPREETAGQTVPTVAPTRPKLEEETAPVFGPRWVIEEQENEAGERTFMLRRASAEERTLEQELDILLEAELADVFGSFVFDEDVLSDPELRAMGEDLALAVLMRRAGKERTDAVYRRIFDQKEEQA